MAWIHWVLPGWNVGRYLRAVSVRWQGAFWGGLGRATLVPVALVAAFACAERPAPDPAREPAFPDPDRRVADIVAPSWDSEHNRDQHGEADRVMDLLGITNGSRVADLGAGSGYYTTRLAKRVGATGKLYAEDIVPAYLDSLRARLQLDSVTGVTVVEGTATDPRLPPGSIDVAVLAHVYHEIENPFEFLWRLQPAFAPGGRLAIVELDRDTWRHGTPLALLTCELAGVGYRRLDVHTLDPALGYLAVFEVPSVRPNPGSIRSCRAP